MERNEIGAHETAAPAVTGPGVVIRSAIFNFLFYVNVTILAVLGFPAVFMERRAVLFIARSWGRTSQWLLEKTCGVRVEIRGLHNLPKGGAIVAPKHQSIFETFALPVLIPDFSFVLKRELTWIPFFGWLTIGGEQIAINRTSGQSAIAEIMQKGRKLIEEDRTLIIFPEGTRRPVGAPPRYKQGVGGIYAACEAPCTPVALNTGLFWPRRSFLRRPGLAVIEFLPPIPPGLPKEEFLARLQNDIETATNALVEEAYRANPALRRMVEAEHAAKRT